MAPQGCDNVTVSRLVSLKVPYTRVDRKLLQKWPPFLSHCHTVRGGEPFGAGLEGL